MARASSARTHHYNLPEMTKTNNQNKTRKRQELWVYENLPPINDHENKNPFEKTIETIFLLFILNSFLFFSESTFFLTIYCHNVGCPSVSCPGIIY